MQKLYPQVYDELCQRREAIIDALHELEWASIEEVVSAAKLSESDALNCLRILTKQGRVKRVAVEDQYFFRLA
jgi:Fe2+ or Zn2+ uptake regulation protein